MIISAAIVSKTGNVFHSTHIPHDLKKSLTKHTKNFLYALSIEDDDVELPYLETTNLRYIYKQTDDLYWVLVTKPESNMFTDIDLLGRFVCTIMEYGASETNSATLTDEQRELFYRHIWRPWDQDAECPTCGGLGGLKSSEHWEREFEDRLRFLNSIRDGHLDDSDAIYFNGLMAEAWTIIEKLSPRHKSWHDCDGASSSETDSFCSTESESISEETLIDGCRLKCRLEDIRIEIRRLKDPYLRLFARRNLLPITNSNFNYKSCTAPSIEEMNSSQSQ